MANHQKYGRLRLLSEPNGDVTNPSFDIVALHGIAGSWDGSWTSSDRYSWLSNALPVLYPSSRVISIDLPDLLEDLATHPTDADGLIIDLIQERIHSDRSEVPIIFIGHSFGGVFLKQVYTATHSYTTTRSDYQKLHNLIRGYVFLGTPHKDIDAPDISKLWRAIAANGHTISRSSTLHRALLSTSKINSEFCRLGGEDVPNVCFYETMKTCVGLQQRYIVTRDEATISSITAEVTPLDAIHQELGICSHAHDGNLPRLLRPFHRLMKIAEEPIVRQQVAQTRRLHLLSLDGGGVKGLFSILILQRLLAEVQRMEGDTTRPTRACDYFDLIGGTSTGGLLAIMLGRLQMDTAACIRTYRALAKKIFRRNPWVEAMQPLPAVASAIMNCSWYSGSTLKDSICDTIADYLPLSERDQLASNGHRVDEARFMANTSTPSRCFVCAVPSGEHKVERIRSYRSIDLRSRDTSSYRIWEAACATSAAPMYFPKVQIGDRSYFDGGLESNNPVVEVIEEARREFPGAEIETVVSIGTGKSSVSDPTSPYNIVMHFIQRATNTEAQHQRVLEEDTFAKILPGYFRLQGETALGEIDLAGFDKLDKIEILAEDFLSSSEGTRMIHSCAVRLARYDQRS